MTTKAAEITVDEIRAELCRKDFAEYCKFVHERPLYRHQREWVNEIERIKSRVLIIAPPESFKSSTMRMRMEWEIGNNPDLRVLLVMNTAIQAQRQVMSIGETLLSNAKYRQVFPWVEANPKRGWSHEVLFVKRKNESLPDPTLYGTGIDGPYQGSHVDRIFCDDPTDQQDVKSSTTMEQQRARLHGVLLDRLEENGSFIGILTRWGEADLVRDFTEMGFSVLVNPVEGRYLWGRLLCPEVFGDDRLAAIRVGKGMNGQLYQLTYMCNPAASEGALLKREWWRRYSSLPEMERVIHSWDLSTGRSELGDYSAYQSWGISQDGFYLIDAGRWRLPGDALEQKMKLLYEKSVPHPQHILVEDAGNAIPVIQSLQSHTRLPLLPIKPGRRDKVARLQGVQGLIEGGRVWLPAAAPWLQDFLDETAAFPGGAYDDQCLVAGTLVATSHGDVPIEQVRSGMKVITPIGTRNVIWAGQTGYASTIHWKRLTGTATHKVFVEGRGFIPMIDALTQALQPSKLSVGGQLSWMFRTQLPFKGFCTDSWEARDIITLASQSPMKDARALGACMSQFGRLITKSQFREAFSFTTRMVTGSITILLTLFAYHVANISHSILCTIPTSNRSTSHVYVPLLPHGTAARKARHGILSMPLRWANESLRYLSAKFVVGSFQLRGRQCTVPRFAVIAGELPKDDTLLLLNVSSVGSSLKPSNPSTQAASLKHAVVNAGQLLHSETKQPVYNLTVANAGCFFANGVLVSNCDALSQGLEWLDKEAGQGTSFIVTHYGVKVASGHLKGRRRFGARTRI